MKKLLLLFFFVSTTHLSAMNSSDDRQDKQGNKPDTAKMSITAVPTERCNKCNEHKNDLFFCPEIKVLTCRMCHADICPDLVCSAPLFSYATQQSSVQSGKESQMRRALHTVRRIIQTK